MKNHDAETDEFIRHFNDFPDHRQDSIANFIKENKRVLLNIPGYGPARRISAFLREGPFSDFYEFEKGLARALHPVLSALNLNIISDILINAVFSEKYHFYSRDINYILASNKKLVPDALKSVIINMVERDGHCMVVKFYDLVLRLIDSNLYRELKPAELRLIDMKKKLGDSSSENTAKIVKIYKAYRKTHGDAAARSLFKRVEWDQELRNYLINPEDEPAFMGIKGDEPAGASPEELSDADSNENEPEYKPGSDKSSGESVAAAPWEDRVARYAGLIKEGYLIKKEPTDVEGIRSIVEGMAVKNEKVSGPEKASDIVRDVLAFWIGDDSLDALMRGTLEKIRDERLGQPAPEEEPTFEGKEPPADTHDEAGEDMMEEEMAETAPAEDASEPMEAGVTGEEMSAILKGISDEPPGRDEPSATAAGRDAPDQGDEEEFLIRDEIHEQAEGKPHPGKDDSDSFLIRDEETENEIPDEIPDKASADQDFIEDMIAADEFVIQDELLYEDKSLKKKNRKGKTKPSDG
jgi:hypothetical protein